MKKKIFGFLRLAAAPLKLLLLAVPLVALMVYVNYTVDCSGLFQGDLTNRTIVELLLSGNNVSGFNQMDQRAVLELYAALVPEESAPKTLALGSSRVMQITRDVVNSASFYNCGVTGGDYRDVMNAFYSFEKYDKLPERVILGVDPWLLRGDALDDRSDAALYSEFLSVDLGYPTDYEPPVESDTYRRADALVTQVSGGAVTLPQLNITSLTLSALFEPAYFQGNVRYYQRSRQSLSATTEDGEVIPYTAVSDAALRTNTEEIKLADGSIWYAEDFRAASESDALSLALEQSGDLLRMEGYSELDTEQCALFQAFVAYLQERGVSVYFYLSPYHPFLYEYETIYNFESHAGFYEIEPYLRSLAADMGIPVIGSYSPFLLGLSGSDFYDGLHVRESGIEKFFGGLSATGEVLPGTAVDSNSLFYDDAHTIPTSPAQLEQLQNAS